MSKAEEKAGAFDVPKSHHAFFRSASLPLSKGNGPLGHGVSASPGAGELAKLPFGARASRTEHTLQIEDCAPLARLVLNRSDDNHDSPDDDN